MSRVDCIRAAQDTFHKLGDKVLGNAIEVRSGYSQNKSADRVLLLKQPPELHFHGVQLSAGHNITIHRTMHIGATKLRNVFSRSL